MWEAVGTAACESRDTDSRQFETAVGWPRVVTYKPRKRTGYVGSPQVFDTWPEGENRVLLADVISLLAMTMSAPTDAMPESLKYRLLGTPESLGSFGHEYVRNLAGEIG